MLHETFHIVPLLIFYDVWIMYVGIKIFLRLQIVKKYHREFEIVSCKGQRPTLILLVRDTIAHFQAMTDCTKASNTIAGGNDYSECSTAFARSLKGWDDISTIIVSLNNILFHSKCKESSPTHDPTIYIDVVVQELF